MCSTTYSNQFDAERVPTSTRRTESNSNDTLRMFTFISYIRFAQLGVKGICYCPVSTCYPWTGLLRVESGPRCRTGKVPQLVARGERRAGRIWTRSAMCSAFSPPWAIIVGRGPRALGAAMPRQGGGGLHFSILFERPVKGDRAMRRIKIVLVSGRCRRDDRRIGTCRQPALYYWPGAGRRAGHARERNPRYRQRAHKPLPPRLPGGVGVSRADRPRQRSPPCAR